MRITTKSPLSGPRASYSRNSKVLAEQSLSRHAKWSENKKDYAKRWGMRRERGVDAVIRDSATETFKELENSEKSTSTERALAKVALWTGESDRLKSELCNQATAFCMQAIAAQPLGPAGLVVAKTALSAQEQLRAADSRSHNDSLNDLFTGLQGLGLFNPTSQDLLAKGLSSNSREQKLDILTQLVTSESRVGGSDGDYTEIKQPRGIQNTQFLRKYGMDLSKLALDNKLGPYFGRQAETRRAGVILTRRSKNNAVFIGPAGVGKTAVVEKLALDAVTAGGALNGKTIVQLDLAGMVAGTRYRGMFEERLKGVIEEASKRDDIVLFIDELHTIIGAGSSMDSTMDAANILKPALARGDIQILGATTQDEYEKHILQDPAMERRFAPISLDEPSQEDTVSILGVLREGFQSYHGVDIPEPMLKDLVEKADKGQPDRYFPDKAIDLMDEAISSARIAGADTLTAEHVDKAMAQMQKGAESLIRYGRDLSRLAEEDKLGPFTGRVAETRSLERTLLRAGKSNPVLVGAGGVGKTAIVEKLAVDMQSPDHHLHGKRLIELSMTELVAGTDERGEFEERMKQVLRAAKRDPNVILFIDEVHTLMGAGKDGGAMDAANMLKPALARGELTLIGATTLDEYREHITKDPALERRFDPIFVDELNPDEALAVLKAVTPKFEKHHSVDMPEDLMPTLITLADDALPSRKRPDKVIDVLDLALSEAHMRGESEVTEAILRDVCKELKRKEEALAG